MGEETKYHINSVRSERVCAERFLSHIRLTLLKIIYLYEKSDVMSCTYIIPRVRYPV